MRRLLIYKPRTVPLPVFLLSFSTYKAVFSHSYSVFYQPYVLLFLLSYSWTLPFRFTSYVSVSLPSVKCSCFRLFNYRGNFPYSYYPFRPSSIRYNFFSHIFVRFPLSFAFHWHLYIVLSLLPPSIRFQYTKTVFYPHVACVINWAYATDCCFTLWDVISLLYFTFHTHLYIYVSVFLRHINIILPAPLKSFPAKSSTGHEKVWTLCLPQFSLYLLCFLGLPLFFLPSYRPSSSFSTQCSPSSFSYHLKGATKTSRW